VAVSHPHSVRSASWRSVTQHRDLHVLRVRSLAAAKQAEQPSQDQQAQRRNHHPFILAGPVPADIRLRQRFTAA